MSISGQPDNPGLERYILRISLYVVMGMSVVAALGDKVSPSGSGAGTAWVVFAVCLSGLAISARDFVEE